MNLLKISALGLILASTGVAADDCVNPTAPAMPDGASSTMEQMIAGQKGVKAFQAANIEYMSCLEARFTAAEAQSVEGSDDEKATAKETYEKSIDAYNAAVSAEEQVAGQFNTEIRAYKAANPK